VKWNSEKCTLGATHFPQDGTGPLFSQAKSRTHHQHLRLYTSWKMEDTKIKGQKFFGYDSIRNSNQHILILLPFLS